MGSDETVAWDVYREIHMAELVDEWLAVRFALRTHLDHEHEDAFCDELIERHAPQLREELPGYQKVAVAGRFA